MPIVIPMPMYGGGDIDITKVPSIFLIGLLLIVIGMAVIMAGVLWDAFNNYNSGTEKVINVGFLILMSGVGLIAGLLFWDMFKILFHRLGA